MINSLFFQLWETFCFSVTSNFWQNYSKLKFFDSTDYFHRHILLPQKIWVLYFLEVELIFRSLKISPAIFARNCGFFHHNKFFSQEMTKIMWTKYIWRRFWKIPAKYRKFVVQKQFVHAVLFATAFFWLTIILFVYTCNLQYWKLLSFKELLIVWKFLSNYGVFNAL